MKKVGIIGGFGPETTALFQLRLNDICLAKKTTARPGIITWNTSVPMALERNLILKGKGVEKFLPLLTNATRMLEISCADFIVLPCNTLHIHLEKLRQISSVPILNIVEESINFLNKKGINKIAILGTSITINSRMHIASMHKIGMVGITPSSEDQKDIDQIIHDVLIGKNLSQNKLRLKTLMEKLGNECDNNFLLACTDLQILLNSSKKIRIFDSMEILAQASVTHLLA